METELFTALFTDELKLAEFKAELGYIKNSLIRKIAEKCIVNFPNYFWLKPASSSGKYHPLSDLGVGGLVRHTKNDICVLQTLFTHPYYEEKFTPVEKDCAIVALLIHDSIKYGIEGGQHTVYEHPILVREYYKMEEYFENEQEREQATDLWNVLICPLAESHMGVWNKDKEGKEILPIPQEELQWLVHFADYLASKRYIDVQPNTSYQYMSTSTPPPPTKAQLGYIDSLIKKIMIKNAGFERKIPKTMSEASAYIQELKGLQ